MRGNYSTSVTEMLKYYKMWTTIQTWSAYSQTAINLWRIGCWLSSSTTAGTGRWWWIIATANTGLRVPALQFITYQTLHVLALRLVRDSLRLCRSTSPQQLACQISRSTWAKLQCVLNKGYHPTTNDNFNSCCQSPVIFGTNIAEYICHRKEVWCATSPVYCM